MRNRRDEKRRNETEKNESEKNDRLPYEEKKNRNTPYDSIAKAINGKEHMQQFRHSIPINSMRNSG